jgi:hypothetical protein
VIPALRGVVAVALIIAMVCGRGSLSRADEVPSGWERNDYIAYLVLSNFLGDASAGGEPFVACVVDGMVQQAAYYDKLPDPSRKVLDALTAGVDSHKVFIRPGSACHDARDRVEERATGRAAMYVAAELVSSEHSYCGTHIVNWHHADLWGGGTYYTVDLGHTPPVMPGNEICISVE